MYLFKILVFSGYYIPRSGIIGCWEDRPRFRVPHFQDSGPSLRLAFCELRYNARTAEPGCECWAAFSLSLNTYLIERVDGWLIGWVSAACWSIIFNITHWSNCTRSWPHRLSFWCWWKTSVDACGPWPWALLRPVESQSQWRWSRRDDISLRFLFWSFGCILSDAFCEWCLLNFIFRLLIGTCRILHFHAITGLFFFPCYRKRFFFFFPWCTACVCDSEFVLTWKTFWGLVCTVWLAPSF